MPELAVQQENIELGRKCLRLIRDIADRGASSSDPEQIGYALQELSQVLLERLGIEEPVFHPMSVAELTDLDDLHVELEFVNGCSHDMAYSERIHGPTGSHLS